MDDCSWPEGTTVWEPMDEFSLSQLLASVGVIVSPLAGHTLYSYTLLSMSINLFHLSNKFHCFLNLFC
jgi:hypothetical protein